MYRSMANSSLSCIMMEMYDRIAWCRVSEFVYDVIYNVLDRCTSASMIDYDDSEVEVYSTFGKTDFSFIVIVA